MCFLSFDLHHTAGKVLAIITRIFFNWLQVAERVAAERDEGCGGKSSVGFQIRLERCVPIKLPLFSGILLLSLQTLQKRARNSGWVYYYGLVQQGDFCWREFLLTDFCLGLMSPCLVNEACRMQYDPRVAFRSNTLAPTQYSIQNWFKEQEGQKKDSPWLFRMGLWYCLTPSLSNTSHAGY